MPNPPLLTRMTRLAAAALLLLAAFMLPPAARAQESPGTITVAFTDAKIETVLGIIGSQSGINVSAYGKAGGQRVTVIAQDMPVTSVLDQIANPNGWVYWQEDSGSYGLADQEYYQRTILPTKVIEKIFQPNNIKASELDRAVKGLLTPNVGSSVADDRTNKLIIRDLPQVIERVERFIREIDVQLITRVFYIRHADVADIASKIETYKSGPGTIEVDEKTHQIIVTDLLSNIKKMELLIDILDVGPEIVIYDVNNIGIDGEDLEDLKTIIESIRTEDLLFEVNNKQGVFILEDVPEVHERVEQILAGFDQPVKQVLLQGEILSTNFSKQFDIGLERFAVSEDLFSASAQGVINRFTSEGGQANPLDSTTAGTAPISFANFRDIFPNLTLTGNTLSGQYLGSTVLLQYQAVYNDSSTRVLLQPRLLVKNQESSRIFVGAEQPYLTTFFGGDNVNNNLRTSTQSTVTEGLTFEVTPSISNSYLVELDLQIDNDDAEEVLVADGNSGNRTLIARKRQNVETVLQIPSGQTRVIAGLITTSESQGSSGFPFLSSLPYIGALFGQKGNGRQQSNLMIFLTPTIVEDVLPRATSEDGRRGRLVTDYERVPGTYELDLGQEQVGTELPDDSGIPSDEDLLSGDAAEQSDAMRGIDEARAAREQSQRDEVGATNYDPTKGFGQQGSVSLNTGEGTATTPARTGGRRPRPADSTRGDGGGTPPATDPSQPPPSGGGTTQPPPDRPAPTPRPPVQTETRY